MIYFTNKHMHIIKSLENNPYNEFVDKGMMEFKEIGAM